MLDELKNIDPVELIPLYLAGEANPEQKAEVENWISQSEENRKTFVEIQRAWNAVERVIPLQNIDIGQEWMHLKKETVEMAKVIPLATRKETGKSFSLLKIAASIALMAVSGYIIFSLLYSSRTITIISGNEIRTILLPDKTEITLNRNSILAYKKNYGKDDRTVSLSGEAFFEVTHDPLKHFAVQTTSARIEDLGTSFNVYAGNDIVEVVVKSGKVAMSGNKIKEEKIFLEKGDRGIINTVDGSAVKSENKDINFMSWKTGKMAFNDDSLGYVITCLENTFHSKIRLNKESLKNCRITVSFENQPLEDVLEIIRATLGLTISKQEDQFIIDGPGC